MDRAWVFRRAGRSNRHTPVIRSTGVAHVALTEPAMFKLLLDRQATVLFPQIEAMAQALPGRLRRICGPEYASEPYLPPSLFHDYVVPYNKTIVEIIHRHGGYARIHCHGRLRNILDSIVETGCVGLDPIEPVPQGDVELSYVRERYGDRLVLFGNIEMSEIATLDADTFRRRVREALRDGTAGKGRGFVLMPSACPISRELPDIDLQNYRIMVEEVEAYAR